MPASAGRRQSATGSRDDQTTWNRTDFNLEPETWNLERRDSRALRLSGPAPVDSHIDPVAVRILNPVVRILIRFRIDLGGKAILLEPSLDIVQIINLESNMVDAFFLVIPFDFDQRDVDVAIGHIDCAAESALRLEPENFLVKLDHLLTIFGHHRNVSDFRSHNNFSFLSKFETRPPPSSSPARRREKDVGRQSR